MAEPYLSRKAFADSQGWVPSYVSKLSKQDRLVLSPCGKKVDVAATLTRLQQTADPAKHGVREHHAQQRVEREVYDQVRHDAPTHDMPGIDYQAAKAVREHYLALLAKAEYQKTSKELVDRTRVEQASFRYGRLLRDGIMGVSRQISAELATLSDPWTLEKVLTEHLRKTLDGIAKLGADDLQQAMTEE